MHTAQLALDVGLKTNCRFDNFIETVNTEALAHVRAAAGGKAGLVYLWGGAASGKSHLAFAACHDAYARGVDVAYFDMSAAGLNPAMLEGAAESGLVVCDGIDAIVARPDWERALFALYEATHAHTPFLVCAHVPPRSLGLKMPDLVTRLGAGLVYQLAALDDAHKAALIRQRAAECGLELGDEVANFMLAHLARDLHALMAVLDALDAASLAAKRRITIPFIRELMGV